MSDTTSWFAARLLIEQTFGSGNQQPDLFEERLVLLKSDAGVDGAEKKAAKFGKAANHSYKNVDGETVTWTFREILDVVQLNESEIGEGSEVYSHLLSPEDVQSVRASLSTPLL